MDKKRFNSMGIIAFTIKHERLKITIEEMREGLMRRIADLDNGILEARRCGFMEEWYEAVDVQDTFEEEADPIIDAIGDENEDE